MTLVDIACARAAELAHGLAYTYLTDRPARASASLTWGELDRRARAIAVALERQGARGERVLMLYPPGLDFVEAFLGCLYAGAIAVPAYEPGRVTRGMDRLAAIAADCRPALVATTTTTAARLDTVMASMADRGPLISGHLTTNTVDTALADAWQRPDIDVSTVAFLQYTSGSTATPRGVMVRHGNLVADCDDIAGRMECMAESVAVSWLPVFHDMGLIFGLLVPLYSGMRVYLMSPLTFLRRPAMWLQTIATYRATHSGGPNFAYELCIERLTPAERAALDLGTWRVAFNGAEPVRAATMDRFATAFAPSSFTRAAFFPCYGLAEATLMVSGGPWLEPPVVRHVDAAASQQGRVVHAKAGPGSIALVGCGRPATSIEVAIVDPATGLRRAAGEIGEIWVRGGIVAAGYWGRPEPTRDTFDGHLAGDGGGWLRTGDLGFLDGGELFIAGRLKDLIIIAGRNHYPQDLEQTVEACHPALRRGCSAAFAVEHEGEERVAVAVELMKPSGAGADLDISAVMGAIRTAVWDAHDVAVHGIALLKAGTIPKTSSGKIQRRACRSGFVEGSLQAVATWLAPGGTPRPETTAATHAGDTADSGAKPLRLEHTTEAIQSWLVARMAAQVRVPPDTIDVDAPFAYFGLSSRDAVSLGGELGAWLGRELPATLLWEHPSIRALASHLASEPASNPASAPASDRARAAATAEPAGEPATAAGAIAVVGLACRFPGASSVEAFWQLVRDGVDAITQVPPGRWPAPASDVAGDPATGAAIRHGGFLDDVAGFDARFFGIAPREAREMDPQHRLFLEVAWEALERGGHAPSALARLRCGVFAAMGAGDYALLRAAAAPPGEHTAVGCLPSLAAGRLSYTWGFTGPSLTVDTACSSALVAVHMACASLRAGECDVAVVGAANLLLSPYTSIALARRQALSLTGRCRTFDAAADGYVRGEGCGVIVLRRLEDALARRDRIWAVIRGSAINSDGRTNGLTAPSMAAQEAVIRAALADAGVSAGDIQYVEAHGTGTPLGDPMEIRALAAALDADRGRRAPVVVGSVKTNIGHLEAAAGMAGLIKVVLALGAGQIPPHLHVSRPNPEIPWDRLALRIATAPTPWTSSRRYAGVSSFGFSGTNAHVIVEQPPPVPFADVTARPCHILALSGRTEGALGERIERLARHLDANPGLALADVCYTAARQEHHRHRAVVLAASMDELASRLQGLAAIPAGASAGGPPRGSSRMMRGRVPAHGEPRIGFLFSGQGAGSASAGRALYEASQTFRQAFDACAESFAACLGDPRITAGQLFDIDAASATAGARPSAVTIQVALFSLQHALTTLWRSWGVEPVAVLGHSIGEYAAACASGALDVAGAVPLVAERARLMDELDPAGSMAAVLGDEATVARAIAPWAEHLAIAAVNGPRNVVISGAESALDEALAALAASDIEHRRLAVSHGFHSPRMDAILPRFARAARSVVCQPPRLAWVSTLTGQPVVNSVGGEHFTRQLREPVRFHAAMDRVAELGCDVFLEIGPSAALAHLGQQCLPERDALWLSSLRSRQEPWVTVLGALAELHLRGAPIDWHACFADVPCALVELPGHPLERARYWLDPVDPDVLMDEATQHQAPTTPAADPGAILGELRDILARLLQLDPGELDPDVSLLEMGADSLALLQAIHAVEQHFGVRLTVRQLFEELTTLRAAAEHIERTVAQTPGRPGRAVEHGSAHLEPEPLQRAPVEPRAHHEVAAPPAVILPGPELAAPAALPAIPAAAVAPAPPAGELHQLLARQLDAMSQLTARQLELLREVHGLQPAARTGRVALPAAEPAPAPAAATQAGAPRAAALPAAAPPAAAPRLPAAASHAPAANAAGPDTRRFLAELIERYNARTAGSKQYAARYRPVMADLRSFVGFRPSIKEMVYPLVKDRARGSRLWDIDGNEYVDLTMGFGVHLFGHAPDFIDDAIRRELDRGLGIGPRSELGGPVAERLCRMLGFERVAFCVSGTDAVHLAIRLARATVGRHRIALFRGAYHGHGDVTQARAEREPDGRTITLPAVPGVPRGAVEDTVVLDYGSEESLAYLEAHVHELGAVLVEPVQSRFPAAQPGAFLRRVRELTAAAGTALICDEMITGFRVHPGGAQAWFGIRADIATYGKILGGGMPIGAVAGDARFLDRIDGGRWRYGDDSRPDPDVSFFGSTHAVHPLAMAAALAVLDHIEAAGPALQAGLNARTEAMAARINALFAAEKAPMRVDHFGSLFRFEVSGNRDPFFYLLAERGVYVWEGRSCFLSTAHSEDDVDHVVRAVEYAVRAMQDGGLLPRPPGSVSAAPAGSGSGASRAASPPAGRASAGATLDRPMADIPWQRRRGTTSLLAPRTAGTRTGSTGAARDVDFSLFYFGTYDPAYGDDKYRLLIEGARFADQRGFAAVWVPERHFHAFGGISPNPAVVAAALASETRRIGIRAGSVVLPLHHPVRVAEEWSVVDNLSGGRAGVAFAAGWHANDFVLAPAAYEDRRERLLRDIDTVRCLWRGQPVSFAGPGGRSIEVALVPRPRQAELPCWLSVVNNPDTYEQAGALGAGVLTSLLGQSMDELAERIALYREAHRRHGHDPAASHVVVLVHAFVGHDLEATRAQARAPFQRYLRASVGLFNSLVRTLGQTGGMDQARAEDMDYLLDRAYERYVADSALIGTPESCAAVVDGLAAIGVDEIACLVDFGVAQDAVLAGLEHLDELRRRRAGAAPARAAGRQARRPATSTLPATAAQQQLFTLSKLSPGGNLAYVLYRAIDVRGRFDRDALAAALAQLVARHEALRATFRASGDLVDIHDALPAALDVTDLGHMDGDARGTALSEIIDDEGMRPVDLENGPMLHVHLVCLAPAHQVLILRVHHALVDGWSLGVLGEELLAMYAAARAAGTPPLPPAPRWSDHLSWQRERVATPEFAADEAFWLDVLRPPLPEGTGLALDGSLAAAPAGQTSFAGGRITRPLDVDRGAMAAMCKRHGLTRFMLLCGSFAALMHRLSGQDDLVIGVPTGNRRLPDDAHLIGYCAHLLPIRSALAAGATAAGFLQTIRARLLEAYEHQHLPFAHLVDELRARRDPATAPVTRLMFNMDRRVALPQPDGMTVTLRPTPISHTHLDLTVNVLEDGDELWIDCDFRRDRFSAQAIERLLERWHVLLHAMLANPAAPVARLPLMADAELATLTRWGTGAPADSELVGVDQRIAAQVARVPDAVAITAGEQIITYRELGERAGRLADRLCDAGVGPEVPVGIFLDRSPEQVVAILAIMEAGGAFVPLDIAHPERRLATLMDEAGVHLVVTRSALRRVLPPGAEALIIDEPGPAAEPRALPRRWVAPGDLAYVMFTSGSTGRPKGVEIEHGSLATYLDWTARRCLGHGGHGMPLFGALTFDLTLVSLFLPLMAGQTVDIITEQQGVSGLARALVDRPVPYAAIALTPTHLGLLDSLLPEGATAPAPGLVLIAGEALDGRLVRRWQQRWPGAIMLNKYGPTEATVLCTAYRVPADQPDGPVPIGRPIDGAALFVLDAALEPAPAGAIGELYIGGPCVARGYRRDPGRTAERFIDDPRGRLYRTGDLAYWRADGELVFVGRVDHQVKIRGQRIEPGEIEVALGQHPVVAQCVVGPWRDAHDEQRLVAWIVPRAGAALDAVALRDHLGARLPAPLVPSYFVAIERVPLTASGKVDRGSLPPPIAASSPAADPGATSGESDARERRMLAIWSRVLGDPALTVDDRFIDRGGDSLLAVRLAAEISRELGTGLDAGDVYRYPSARLMVRALAGDRRAAADVGRTLVLRPGVAQSPLFLFHPVGGHVLCYGGLCRALGGERPVIGVRARGSEPGESPIADIAAMARLYFDDIRGIQPHGPYLLAGWSMGGLIAFEVARLARAHGEQVALLAMIDSKLASADEIDTAMTGPGAWAHVLSTLASVPPEHIEVPADLPVQPDAHVIEELWQRLAGTGVSALVPTVADFDRFVRMFHAHAEAMRRYVPAPLELDHAVLVVPRQERARDGSVQLERWRERLSRLQIIEVPGDHFTVVRADVAVVASRLARAIEAAPEGPA